MHVISILSSLNFSSDGLLKYIYQTTGFALIYDSLEAAKKFEPQYRLVRVSRAYSLSLSVSLSLS